MSRISATPHEIYSDKQLMNISLCRSKIITHVLSLNNLLWILLRNARVKGLSGTELKPIPTCCTSWSEERQSSIGFLYALICHYSIFIFVSNVMPFKCQKKWKKYKLKVITQIFKGNKIPSLLFHGDFLSAS